MSCYILYPNGTNSQDMAVAALFSFTTPPNVKKLLGWKQGDEEDKWALRAVEALEKKLRKNKGSIDDLQNALATQSPNSKCVTIPRSLDGRLQVSHRKALPHVIYCRVWRWPDLQSHHELKCMETCEFGFENKAKDVCINPYHYRRIESAPVLPPVLVPRFPTTNGQIWKPTPDPPIPYNHSINTPNFEYEKMYGKINSTLSSMTMVEQGIPIMGHGQQVGLPLSPHTNPGTPGSSSQQNVLSPKSVTSPQSCVSSPGAAVRTTTTGEFGSYGSPNPYPVQSPPFTAPYTVEGNMPPTGGSCVFSTANNQTPLPMISSPSFAQSQFIDQKPPNANDCTAVHLKPSEIWATFSYYELNTRVGDPFRAHRHFNNGNYVIIDGYTEPGSTQSRFCLGQLSNVSRNNTVEKTRKHIGRGVKISYEDGQVFIECLGDSAVFVQSRNSNKEYRFHPSTVVKIQKEVKLKIFSDDFFHQILTDQDRLKYMIDLNTSASSRMFSFKRKKHDRSMERVIVDWLGTDNYVAADN